MLRDENDDSNFGIKRFSQGELIFSNSVEVLFEHLKVNLFSIGEKPFSKRVLICPSSAMQSWIQLQLASSLSISAGLNCLFLNKAIEFFIETLFDSPINFFFPTQLELTLRIDHEISEELNRFNPLFEPLRSYLAHKDRRRIALAEHLAKQFLRYGIFANQAVHDWERSPSNWQESLWSKIFQTPSNAFHKWDYPLRRLLSLKPKTGQKPDLAIHLFAFSHLSPLHFHFFSLVSKIIPVFFYHLSPCQEFWSDLNSEMHPLLKNLGKVGRTMAKMIEESGLPSEEPYLTFSGKTQIRQLQRELLLGEQIEETLEDDSIQLHLAATPYEEIEKLHSHLLSLVSSSHLEPQDILVMAPNISVYAPYIKHVFGKTLGYQIADLPMQTSSLPAQALFLLLDLEKRRLSAPAVLELLDHPLFRKKNDLSEEDILLIRDWVQKAGITWGFDQSHRDRLLKKSHCKRAMHAKDGTWKEGIGLLIEELAIEHTPSRVDYTQAQLLGTLARLIAQLHVTTQVTEQSLPLSDWVLYLKESLATYFSWTEETSQLISKLDKIAEAGRFYPEKCYHFSFIYSLIQESLGRETVTINRNKLQAVRFCSMLPMRAIPSKIICLIGMNHDTFPRKDELKNLDLLHQNPKCDYSPSRLDFDRHLFLEALLSVREKLYISYLGKDPYDLSELPPSSVVLELLPFISKKQIYPYAPHYLCETESWGGSFTIQTKQNHTLPSGKFVIETSELVRLSRSALQHYLYFQELKMQSLDPLKGEEEFLLSPLKKSLLLKAHILGEQNRAENLPIGMFKKIADSQLKRIIDNLPQSRIQTLHLPPQEITLSSTCTVIITGKVEGVYDKGLCLLKKCDLKNLIKSWPLVLALFGTDQTKRNVFFTESQMEKELFFDDATPYLADLLSFYFYAKENPVFLIADWVAPILKNDLEKLKNAPTFDPSMQWYLRGKNFSIQEVLDVASPWVKKLYREVANAWF